jgi:hypothetical protein
MILILGRIESTLPNAQSEPQHQLTSELAAYLFLRLALKNMDAIVDMVKHADSGQLPYRQVSTYGLYVRPHVRPAGSLADKVPLGAGTLQTCSSSCRRGKSHD